MGLANIRAYDSGLKDGMTKIRVGKGDCEGDGATLMRDGSTKNNDETMMETHNNQKYWWERLEGATMMMIPTMSQ